MKKKQCTSIIALLATATLFGGGFSDASSLKAMESPFLYETTIDQDSGSLTITLMENNPEDVRLQGAHYSIYKIMSLTHEKTFVKEEAFAKDLENVSEYALGSYSSVQIENLCKQLAVTASDDAIQPTAAGTSDQDGIIKWDALSLGYYLVIEDKAPNGYVSGKPFLVAIPSTNNYADATQEGTHWVYDVQVTPKNESISINKELSGDASVKEKDHIAYQIQTAIPNYNDHYFGDEEHPATFAIYDQMDDGLLIENDEEHPIEVLVDHKPVPAGKDTYHLTIKNETGENPDLIISFAQAYIKAHGGESVVVNYHAQVSDRAVQGPDGNTNRAYVRYDHKPQETITSAYDQETVYSFGIQIEKFTKEEGRALAGASFDLLTEDGKVIASATSDEQGNITYPRLDEGTYYIKETKSPAGYTLLAEAIKLEIIANEDAQGRASDGTFKMRVNDKEIVAATGEHTTRIDQAEGKAIIAIANQKGFALPLTGGMGIIIYLMIGGIGILGISLILYKKSKKQA